MLLLDLVIVCTFLNGFKMMNFPSLPVGHGNRDACFSEEHMKTKELHLIFNAVTHLSVSLVVNFDIRPHLLYVCACVQHMVSKRSPLKQPSGA